MNLYLIGYRGSGKSSVGQRLAACLKRHWIDTDSIIEKKIGRTIKKIFEESGEPYFREVERTTVCGLEDADLVVSLGGGAILDEQSREHLRLTGKCAWLQASPKVLYERISSDGPIRPALTNLESLQEIANVLQQRTPVYTACADYSVDTELLTLEQAVEQIAQWWQTSR